MDIPAKETILPYIFIASGIAIILYALLKRSNSNSLRETGEMAEGIVFELGTKPPSVNFGSSDNFNTTGTQEVVTVRFVTKKMEWITAEMNQEFVLYGLGQFKAGEKVTVYYDPSNPYNFFVDTKLSEKTIRILIVIFGILFTGAGVFQLLTKGAGGN